MEDTSSKKENVVGMKNYHRHMLIIHDAVDILGGKWKIPIISALIHLGELRFGEIQNILGKITAKTLSKELKELEMNEMIKRRVVNTTHPIVLYAITPHGESCKDVIMALRKWGGLHRKSLFSEIKTE